MNGLFDVTYLMNMIWALGHGLSDRLMGPQIKPINHNVHVCTRLHTNSVVKESVMQR